MWCLSRHCCRQSVARFVVCSIKQLQLTSSAAERAARRCNITLEDCGVQQRWLTGRVWDQQQPTRAVLAKHWGGVRHALGSMEAKEGLTAFSLNATDHAGMCGQKSTSTCLFVLQSQALAKG